VVNPKFFLFTVLRNCLYNHFRKALFFENMHGEELQDRLDQYAENHVTDVLERESMKKEIQWALGLLTERQREVIYCRYIEELSVKEICELMHMNYQSTLNLIQRSLKQLRRYSHTLEVYFSGG
jgi:RNA polymerase sigma factor (sigma-70 family)